MKETYAGVPVIGFAAASGTGKTTLLRAIVSALATDGLRIGCVKHTHHDFDIDHPGKDSHTLRGAGACQTLLGSPRRWALMVDEPTPADDDLDGLLSRLDLARLDVVLVEGFKLGEYPKIEVRRVELAAPQLLGQLPAVIALATNQRPPPAAPVPVFDLDAPAALIAFIRRHLARLHGLQRRRPPA